MRLAALSMALLLVTGRAGLAQQAPLAPDLKPTTAEDAVVMPGSSGVPLPMGAGDRSLPPRPPAAVAAPDGTVMQRSFAIGLEAVPAAGDPLRLPDLKPAPRRAGPLPPLPAPPPVLVMVPPAVAPGASGVPSPASRPDDAPLRLAPALSPASAPKAAEPPAAVSAPVVAPPLVVPPPASPQLAADWRERLDQAFSRVGPLSPNLPAQVLQSIRHYYEMREGALLFTEGAAPGARAMAVLDVAGRAREHGLDPQRFARLADLGRSSAGLERDVALAALAVAYARDARGARINPINVARLITAEPTMPEVAAVLDGLARATTPAAALESWNPQHTGYRALKAQLQRAASDEAQQGRARAGLEGDIIANMERWRWLPPELGAAHVMVNIPAYRLEMRRGDQSVFETRVIVGKAESPTPVFSHVMEYLVVNPYWNVPPSIALKEYLPMLRANPYALQARGLQIVSRGRVVDPASIDWSRMPRSVAIRQPPGERNALGHIKFMFPNDHAVYLHDTPSRGLFSASRRAFSHGCVRVQNPFALATAITGWNEGRLRGMVGGPERRLDLPGDVAVHLAYFTLEAKEDGGLVAHEDIYGHHRRLKRLLGL